MHRKRHRAEMVPLERRQLFSLVVPDTNIPVVANWTLDSVGSTSGNNEIFYDTGGNSALSTAAGFNLTIVNGKGITPQAGVYTNAVTLNGTNQYGDAGPDPGANASLSLSLWIKPTTLQNCVLVSKSPNNATGIGFEIDLTSSGTISFKVGSQQSNTQLSSSAHAYAAGTWAQIAVTFSAGSAVLYVNGSQVASVSGISQTTADQVTNFTLGSSPGGGSYYKGAIDQVRMYNIPISSAAVSAQYQVDQLSETTQPNQLQKADLNWVVSDAITKEDLYASSPATYPWAQSHATSDYTDIASAIANIGTTNLGTVGPVQSNIFPTIIDTAAGATQNPAFASALTESANLLTTARAANGVADFNNPQNFPTYNLDNALTDGLTAAWALGDPQSPYAVGGSSFTVAMLPIILRRLQAGADDVNHFNDPANFGSSSPEAELYLDLNAAFPNIILPTLKNELTQAIETNASTIDSLYGATYRAHTIDTLYTNADVKRIAALAYADVAFPSLNNQYATDISGGLQLISQSIYPDGASPYINSENEQFLYHGILVYTMARFAEITGQATMPDKIISQTYWFYPLAFEPASLANPSLTTGGVADNATEPNWKHYWNTQGVYSNSLIVASVTGSPEDMAIAQMGYSTDGWVEATYWKTTMPTPAPVENNYILYDRNQAGPRGRFGEFSYEGSAAQVNNGDNYAPSSLAGAMVLNTSGGISGAINYAGIGPEPLATPGIVDEETDLTTNTALVGNNVAAIASIFTPTEKSGSDQTGWAGRQNWLFTNQRVVGLLSLTANTTNTDLSVQGVINLLGVAVTNGTLTQDANNPNIYYDGNLAIDLVQTSFGSGTTLTQTVVTNPDSSGTGLTLAIRDNAASTSTVYPAGTTRYFMVELYDKNQTTNDSSGITRISTSNGLTGMIVAQGSSQYTQVSNPTASPLTYTVAADGSNAYFVHTSGPTSGEEYEPGWRNTYNTSGLTDWRNPITQTTPYYQPPGTFTVTIPAHSQILVERTAADPAWLATSSVAMWNAASQVLTVLGPTSIIANPASDEPLIQAGGPTDAVTFNPSSPGAIDIGSLSLTYGASASLTSVGAARSLTNYRLLVIGTPGTTVAPMFTIDSTSTLDLADNDLAILYGSGTSPLPQVQEYLQTGSNYNASSGAFQWNGTGLISSVAPTTGGATGLGYATESELSAISQAAGGSAITTFDGQSLGANAVLVKYTLMGDSTLSGTVSGTDYNAVLANYDTNGDWSQGNFHYGGTTSGNTFTNGQIAGQDYNTVLSNYDGSLAAYLPGGTGPALAPAAAVAVKPGDSTTGSSATSISVHKKPHSPPHRRGTGITRSIVPYRPPH